MKKRAMALFFLACGVVYSQDPPFSFEDTWSNWEKRLERAFDGVVAEKLPGRCAGILVPSDSREDLLPLTAIGYQTLTQNKIKRILFLIPAPSNVTINGLMIPGSDAVETSIGRFPIDQELRNLLQSSPWPVTLQPDLFTREVPRILYNQLASLKYTLARNASQIAVLPVYVKFENPQTQVKDYAPFLAEIIKDAGLENELGIVVVSNLSHDKNPQKIIQRDNTLLSALRNQDVDTILIPDLENVELLDRDSLALGLLLLRSLYSDHAQILAYAHSSQLVLTKDKSKTTSYVTAGFATAPALPQNPSHFNREKLVDIFDELVRGDLLTITRQTVASILDPLAAKPGSFIGKEGAQKWPVYVSLFGPDGTLAGQAGTHISSGPLEESIRKFSLEAVNKAKPELTKSNFANYVVDISIPYGFFKANHPEELIPLLNGVVVYGKLKTAAFHPEAWRTFPDPHELLSSICVGLGLKPWAYATGLTRIESFRVLSFNEKEPFQDLGSSLRKKKKKNTSSTVEEKLDDETESGGNDGGGGSGSLFGF